MNKNTKQYNMENMKKLLKEFGAKDEKELEEKVKNEILLVERDKEQGCLCCHSEIARTRLKRLKKIIEIVL